MKYAEEIGYPLDAQYFVDSNTAKGWVVGQNKTPMKEWKAVVRTWFSNHKKRNPEIQTQPIEEVTISDLFKMSDFERHKLLPTLPEELQKDYRLEYFRQRAM